MLPLPALSLVSPMCLTCPCPCLTKMPICRLAAQPSKLPYYLALHDQGGGTIDWPSITRDVLAHGPLPADTCVLTRSGHIALGVSVHVGRDMYTREFDLAVRAFLAKPAGV